MKAAVNYEGGGPEVLAYEDLPDPECPEGCVVIDVEAISIEGGDLLARASSSPPGTPHVADPRRARRRARRLRPGRLGDRSGVSVHRRQPRGRADRPDPRRRRRGRD